MTQARRLGVVLGLNLALIAALIVVGITAHSLGVFEEGADYLADAAGIAVALAAIRADRRTRQRGRTAHASTWAAAVNTGWLLVLQLLILATGIARLARGTPKVSGLPVLVVSGSAAAVMLVGALILHGAPDVTDPEVDDALSVRAVLLDTAADAAAAAGVAASGAVIFAIPSANWLDPVVALVIAAVVATHSIRLLRQIVPRLRYHGSATTR